MYCQLPVRRAAADCTESKNMPNHGRLFLWSLVPALAGFLFGFDTVVISGAEKTIQQLWNLSPEMHGLAMGAALCGTVLGSLVGSWPTDQFGRKKTLLYIGVLFLVGSIWSVAATEAYSFMIARFIGGIAIGVSTVAAPLYISEISPPEHCGRLAGMFQFNIVFGILAAFLPRTDPGRNPTRPRRVLIFTLPSSQRDAHRAMVRAKHVRQDFRRGDAPHERSGDPEVVDPPADIPLTRTTAERPPGIRIPLVRMEMAERVGEARV